MGVVTAWPDRAALLEAQAFVRARLDPQLVRLRTVIAAIHQDAATGIHRVAAEHPQELRVV